MITLIFQVLLAIALIGLVIMTGLDLVAAIKQSKRYSENYIYSNDPAPSTGRLYEAAYFFILAILLDGFLWCLTFKI
jgi:hypothetical protein